MMKKLFHMAYIPSLFIVMLSLSQLIALPAHAEGRVADAGAGAFGGLVLIVLITLALAGLSMVWRGLFTKRVEWTGEIVRRMPWGSFFFGLIIAVVVLALIAILSKGGKPGGLLALIILLTALFLMGGSGISALTDWLGGLIDPAASGIRKALYGSAAWTLMLCIPILGWALMAGLFLAGAGASMVAYFPTRPAQPDVQVEPQSPSSQP
jgi:hypothetical protein